MNKRVITISLLIISLVFIMGVSGCQNNSTPPQVNNKITNTGATTNSASYTIDVKCSDTLYLTDSNGQKSGTSDYGRLGAQPERRWINVTASGIITGPQDTYLAITVGDVESATWSCSSWHTDYGRCLRQSGQPDSTGWNMSQIYSLPYGSQGNVVITGVFDSQDFTKTITC